MRKFVCLFMCYLVLVVPTFAKDLRFVQVTDVRYSSLNENTVLKDFIKTVNKDKSINFVVFTGDNIAKPDSNELKSFLSEIKKIKAPVYIVIGDKDVNKRKDLGKKQYLKIARKKLSKFNYDNSNYVFEKSGIVFVVADGAKEIIPGTNGYYKDSVIDWVDANLTLNSKKNVIILQHFPLVPPAAKDSYYTYKADSYLKMLNKHKNVKAIVAGHFGINKEQTVDGIIHISTAPLPFYRIIDIIGCDSGNPEIWAQIKEIQ